MSGHEKLFAESIAIVGCRPPPRAYQPGLSARHWKLYDLILEDVRAFVATMPPGTVLVSGGARGVDYEAAKTWVARQGETKAFLPDYEAYEPKRAPLERNTLIVGASRVVHAWPAPWSRGTYDTIRKASDNNLPTWVHTVLLNGKPSIVRRVDGRITCLPDAMINREWPKEPAC